MNFGLSDSTVSQITSVFRQFQVIELVIIYGSRAKGNYHEGSDIDLVIKSKALSFDELLTVKGKIDDLLIPYSIDISLYSQIDNTDLVNHINRIGKPFYIKQSNHE